MSEGESDHPEKNSCLSCRIIGIAGPYAVAVYSLYAYGNHKRSVNKRDGTFLLLIAVGFSMLGTYTLFNRK